MKRILFLSVCLLIAPAVYSAGCSRGEKAVMNVISRSLGHTPENVSVRIVGQKDSLDFFTTEVSGGVLKITASSPSAACRGFYDYVNEQHYGMSTWSVNNMQLPSSLEDSPLKRVDCNVKYRYYLNPCTFCYTAPYWTWEEWEKELDRMALHGVNMALAYTGFEAIFYRVWKKLGLTDEEIDDFVTGPAHLTWSRIGNMSSLDGGLSQEYYRHTLELQHKILDRMEELGMTPIFASFAGFVPDGIKRLYPEVEILEAGWKYIPSYVSNFLPVETELFKKIAGMYFKEMKKEFGKVRFFQANSFNEMKVPFAPKGTQERFEQISSYGKAMYESIAEFVPDGVWVLGGWMFGYSRNIWDPESMRAMFSAVPDDGMMLLDLAEDFNHDIWENESTWEYAPAIYGKPWVYSTVPNFGGRTAPAGNLEFYLNGHLNALESPNRGRMAGIGSAPEGVENNEVVYELIFDAPWSSERRDIRQRLRDYSMNRYGACPAGIERFWEGMLATSYGFSTSQGIYRVQRQPYFMRGGRYDVSQEHFEAIESFISASSSLSENQEYLTDLALWAGFYAFGKAEIIADMIERCYKMGDLSSADALRVRFREAMLAADRFLDSNPVTRMERWIGLARNLGSTEDEKDRFEINARRIVTTWGPGKEPDYLNDYSCRIWSGLIRDYYLPRCEHYFDSRSEGVRFDFDGWEYRYAEDMSGVSPSEPYDDLVQAARALVDRFSDIVMDEDELSGWNTFDISKGTNMFSYMLYPSDYSALEGLRFRHVRGDGSVRISKIRIRGQRDERFCLDGLDVVVGKYSDDVCVDLDINDPQYRKYLYLEIYVEAENDNEESEVILEMLKK